MSTRIVVAELKNKQCERTNAIVQRTPLMSANAGANGGFGSPLEKKPEQSVARNG